MSGRLALKCVLVCGVVFLFIAGSASAQTTGIFKVSDAIEGTAPGVSVARCGPGIIVGFGDGEPNNPNSVAGYAISRNASLFTDLGVLPVAPQNPNATSSSFLGPSTNFVGTGNPAVACSNQSHIYYGSLFTDYDDCPDLPCTAISVSASSDTGQTWGFPIVASKQSADIYQFASPALAVDGTNPSRLYVAYINSNQFNPFDFILDDCSGGNGGTILEFTSSSDGGKTWTPRTQLDHACSPPVPAPIHPGSLITPNIAVSPTGEVLLTYEFQAFNDGSGQPNEIRVLRSSDNGKSFSTPSIVSTTATANATPQLAVDRSSSASRGAIYLTWSGARSAASTDVLISDSVDGGASFSFAMPVNPAPVTSAGHFQTDPVVAVDFDGDVAACYYQTPGNAPTSSSVYSFNCATSFNHGASWTPRLVKSNVPVGYDAVTSDFLLHNDGFITVFEQQVNGTRNVVGQKFETN